MPRPCLSSAPTDLTPPANRLKGKEALRPPEPGQGKKEGDREGRGRLSGPFLFQSPLNNLPEMPILVLAEVQGFRISRGCFSGRKRDFFFKVFTI